MAIGETFELIAEWADSTGVNLNVNTFHLVQTSAPVFTFPMEDLYQRFLNTVVPDYKACVSGSLSLVRVVVYRLVVPLEGTEFFPSDIVGTLAGSQNLPRQISPVVSWRTAFLGRSYRGRTYMPTITEDVQNDGVLNSTYLDLVTAFANAYLTMNDPNDDYGEWRPVVHSTTVPAETPITGFIARSIVGVQRRRKFGVGG